MDIYHSGNEREWVLAIAKSQPQKQCGLIPGKFLDEARPLRDEVCGQYLPDESDDESIYRPLMILSVLLRTKKSQIHSLPVQIWIILTKRESVSSSPSVRARLGLMVGNKYRDRKDGPRKAVTIRHCTISFTMTEAPADGSSITHGRQLQDQHPSARLAFRVYLKDKDDGTETW